MKDSIMTIDSGILSHGELEKDFVFNSVDHLVEIIEGIDLDVQSGDVLFDSDSSYLCFNSTRKNELIDLIKNLKCSENFLGNG